MPSFTRLFAFVAAVVPLLSQAAPVAPQAVNGTIPGRWIIQLKPEVDIAAVAAHKLKVREIHARNLVRRGGESAGIEHEYGFGAFKGYSGAFDDVTVDELKNLPEVRKQRNGIMMSLLTIYRF